MKFPAGTDGGTISNPQDEGFVRELMSFVGAIEIETGSGEGLILTDKGRLIAAYFRSDSGIFYGKEALTHMTLDPGAPGNQTFSLRRYNPAEFSLALRISRDERLLISDIELDPATGGPELPSPAANVPEQQEARPGPRDLPDETRLQKIISQPGVIAVSAFFEGFPVQSIGEADFEHVAASAEDFWRAGIKIAKEMKTGSPDQLILETAQNKFIIAPCGDLYLCIFTTADAPLGLIRVVLKSIQNEINGR